MPKNVSIPITDDATCDCTTFYQVLWRYGSNAYTQQNFNSPLPTKSMNMQNNVPYIYLQNLVDGETYDYIITRNCTNGTISATLTGTFNT